jgi:hypothetical protein
LAFLALALLASGALLAGCGGSESNAEKEAKSGEEKCLEVEFITPRVCKNDALETLRFGRVQRVLPYEKQKMARLERLEPYALPEAVAEAKHSLRNTEAKVESLKAEIGQAEAQLRRGE